MNPRAGLRGALVLLALAAPAVAQGELPTTVFAAAPEDEIQDLVYFGESRPSFIRTRPSSAIKVSSTRSSAAAARGSMVLPRVAGTTSPRRASFARSTAILPLLPSSPS